MPKITSADHCETNDDYMQRRYVNETTDECMERRYVNETTDDCMQIRYVNETNDDCMQCRNESYVLLFPNTNTICDLIKLKDRTEVGVKYKRLV